MSIRLDRKKMLTVSFFLCCIVPTLFPWVPRRPRSGSAGNSAAGAAVYRGRGTLSLCHVCQAVPPCAGVGRVGPRSHFCSLPDQLFPVSRCPSRLCRTTGCLSAQFLDQLYPSGRPFGVVLHHRGCCPAASGKTAVRSIAAYAEYGKSPVRNTRTGLFYSQHVTQRPRRTSRGRPGPPAPRPLRR